MDSDFHVVWSLMICSENMYQQVLRVNFIFSISITKFFINVNIKQ